MNNTVTDTCNLSQAETAEKLLFPTALFEKMLHGEATDIEMKAMANRYSKHGVAALKLSNDSMLQIPKIRESNTNASDSTYWNRYGSTDKPIFSYPIAGSPGNQGAVVISAYQKDTCDMTQFESYLGPFHYHHDVVHITAVTQGEGIFLIAGEIGEQEYLVKVPVRRGDIVLIPANVIHTFFISSSLFHVVSFTTRLIPTNSPDFLVLADLEALKTRTFIDYPDFLKMKNSPAFA